MKFHLVPYRTIVSSDGKYRNQLGQSRDPDKQLLRLDTEMCVYEMMDYTKSICCYTHRCAFCRTNSMWRSSCLPRGFKVHFDDKTDEFWWTNCNRNMETSSVYINGGKPMHKLGEGHRITIREGTVIYFRPAKKHRDQPHFVNMEFEVVDKEAFQKAGVAKPPECAVTIADTTMAVDAASSLLAASLECSLASMDNSLLPDVSHMMDLTLIKSPSKLLSTPVKLPLPDSPTAQKKDDTKSNNDNEDIILALNVSPIPLYLDREEKTPDKAPDPPARRSSYSQQNNKDLRSDPPGNSPAFRSPQPLHHVDITLDCLNQTIAGISALSINSAVRKRKKED